ncbi:MAG: hypothetical protein QXW20_08415 [Ignisphaera sp.]
MSQDVERIINGDIDKNYPHTKVFIRLVLDQLEEDMSVQGSR